MITDFMLHQTYNLETDITIPSDLEAIRYVQLKDGSNNQVF